MNLTALGIIGFGRQRRGVPVDVGGVYCRTVAAGVTETAKVVAVTTDGQDIPHVRFIVRKTHRDSSGAVDLRTLSLESFQRLFGQPVAG